jgi:predicted ATPase
MSIRSIELKGVRVFSHKWWSFELAPITVICGPNSSGKSTVLKSLILLKQNMESGKTAGIPSTSGLLALGGPLVDMGSYASFASKGQAEAVAGLGIRTSFVVSRQAIAGLGSSLVGLDESASESEVELECHVRFRFGTWQEPARGELPRAVRSRLREADFSIMHDEQVLLSWKVELPENRSYAAKSSYLKTPYVLSMPRSYLEEAGGTEFIAIRGRGDSADVRFGVLLQGLLPSMMIGRLRTAWMKEHAPGAVADPRDRAIPLPPLIEAAVDSIRASLEDTRYIGPLRAPAQRVYVSPADAETQLLESDDDYVIQSLRVAAVCTVHDWRPGRGLHETDLHEALQYWLHYMRTGMHSSPRTDELVLDLLGDSIIQPRIRSPYGGRAYAMADSGFGYSQALPILIASLMAKPGETVVIEQPEVHLHPALQLRLADFIVAMSSAGKRFLIETHSEHIVDALRVTLAEQQLEGTAADGVCSVYYVEVGENWPQVTNLSVKSDGTVSDWPASFFGESRLLAKRLMTIRVEASRRRAHHARDHDA